MKFTSAVAACLIVAAGVSAAAAGTRVVFIGNSFLFGSGSAVRFYRADTVTDLNNEGIGGVPALFKSFTQQAGLDYDVSLETRGGAGLDFHLANKLAVIGQSWDTDPFAMVEKGDKLYGRGACDMKGYLACMLAAVPDFKRRALRTPIHLAFSYDEEVGCTGVRPMISELGKTLPKPRMAVIGEPTSMLVVDAHKGPVRWRVELTGRPAHSSMAPLGVNTITYAGRILGELDRIEQELKARTPNKRFDPPYTTLQVTQIEAGAASNIVPESCWFGWEIRALPGFDVEALERRIAAFIDAHCLPEMKAVAPEADVVMRRSNQIPAFAADPGSEILSLALKLAQANETFAVSYATEASLFHAAGSSSVVCGPGDIAQAHGANEWIEIAELEKCMAFMGRLAIWAEG